MKKFDVFISYSRKDYRDENKLLVKNNYVSFIKKKLEEKGLTCWLDEEGIYSSQAFARIIADNIQQAKVFLFISSKNSNSSEWTCREIATAIMYNKPIIPVKIDTTTYAQSIILYLSNLDYIDLTINVEVGLNNIVRAIERIAEKTTKSVSTDNLPKYKAISIKDTLLTYVNSDDIVFSEENTFSAVLRCYAKILSFKGVLNRKVFLLYILSQIVVLTILFLLFFLLCHLYGVTVPPSIWVGTLMIIIPTTFFLSISAIWRRLHDTGSNGFSFLLCVILLILLAILPIEPLWIIIGLVFLVSSLLTIIYLLKDSK